MTCQDFAMSRRSRHNNQQRKDQCLTSRKNQQQRRQHRQPKPKLKPSSQKPPPPPAPEPETVETETETETEITAPPPPPKPPKNDFEKGIAAERKRVTALQKLDKPATHAVIEAAIRDGKQVTDIVDEITVALEKAASASARRTDADILNHVPGSDAGADENEFGGRLKAAVAARKKSRERGSRVNSRN